MVEVLDAEPEMPDPWVPEESGELAELTGTWWWRGVQFAVWTRAGILLVGRASEPRGAHTNRYERVSADLSVGVSGDDRGERLLVLRDPHGRPQRLDIATDLHPSAGRPVRAALILPALH